MLECDYNKDYNQKDQCKNYPKHENTRDTSEIRNLRIQCIFGPHTHTFQIFMMALRQKIEWDPEEVAAGYDLSSIYEGVGENDTVPVISSVVNTTGHPAINISAVVKEVTKQVVEMVVNTIGSTHNSTTLAPTTVAPPSNSFTPSTISTVVKKVVEHLGREPHSPVATVCIYIYI